MFIKEINDHKSVQNEYYDLLQAMSGGEIITDKDDENT
jgi:hypothetical protein